MALWEQHNLQKNGAIGLLPSASAPSIFQEFPLWLWILIGTVVLLILFILFVCCPIACLLLARRRRMNRVADSANKVAVSRPPIFHIEEASQTTPLPDQDPNSIINRGASLASAARYQKKNDQQRRYLGLDSSELQQQRRLDRHEAISSRNEPLTTHFPSTLSKSYQQTRGFDRSGEFCEEERYEEEYVREIAERVPQRYGYYNNM